MLKHGITASNRCKQAAWLVHFWSKYGPLSSWAIPFYIENRVDPDQQGKQAGRYTQYWTKYELFACLVIFHDFFLSSAEYYFF